LAGVRAVEDAGAEFFLGLEIHALLGVGERFAATELFLELLPVGGQDFFPRGRFGQGLGFKKGELIVDSLSVDGSDSPSRRILARPRRPVAPRRKPMRARTTSNVRSAASVVGGIWPFPGASREFTFDHLNDLGFQFLGEFIGDVARPILPVVIRKFIHESINLTNTGGVVSGPIVVRSLLPQIKGNWIVA